MHREHRIYTPRPGWDEKRLSAVWCRPDHVLGRVPEIERPINAHINPKVSGECTEMFTLEGTI